MGTMSVGRRDLSLCAKHLFVAAILAGSPASRSLVALTFSWDLFVHGSINGRSKAARKSGKDDHDEFSLPTGSGFIVDILKVRARGFVTDAEFALSGPKCFSCNEMKC